MLKRILTALILLPIFILSVLKLPPKAFAVLTIALALYAAWEWSALLGIKHKIYRLCFTIIFFPLMSIAVITPISILIWIAAAWWLIALLLIASFPKGAQVWGRGWFWRTLMAMLVILPTWRGINFLRANDGPALVLFLFVLIWVADSAAYFAGVFFGKHKLAPSVSPGKTIEGLFGALLATACISPLLTLLLPNVNMLSAILLGLVTVIFSVIGDLFESMLKRNVGIKDSGQLFPGHGGLLDRIDSLFAALPIFILLGLQWKILH